MKAVYGPVSSWRLGRSLGIDLICSEKKICSVDCVYCQLGRGKKTIERQDFISLGKLKNDLKLIKNVKADVITFSGTGEPTLAKNLKKMISYIRNISNLPLAILTNGSLLSDKEVRKTLHDLDIVVVKLDASEEKIFKKINRPPKGMTFKKYLDGIKSFRESFSGKFSLQMMFIDMNKAYAGEMAKLTKELNPDEIQINTPLRPCAVKPLDKEEIKKIKNVFTDIGNVISVYEAEKPEVKPIDIEEIRIRKRPKP